jgi:hypothetical protein
MRTASPGLVLSAGLAVVALAATAPVGLHGRPVPALSWIVWSVVPIASVALLRSRRGGVVVAARQMALLLPTVLLLTLPAVLFASVESGMVVGGALLARALATAAGGLATVTYLGPVDLVAGLRALRLPERFVDVVHAMLVSLAAIVRQVTEMLRARTARGMGHAPWSALAAVGLTGIATRLPHHLSTGEKRRLCLAGVLASRPGLLLLDEPSSGLDPRGRRELHVLLAGLASTLVIASHDLEFVSRLCTRAVVLDHGAIVAQGPIGEILSDQLLLRRHGLD